MKKLVLSIAILLTASVAFAQTLTKEEIKAQKKEIKEKQALVKEADKQILNDPAGALKTIQPALDSPFTNVNAETWYIASKAKKAIIDKENYNRAQGQPFDTKTLYSSCLDIFNYLEKCDSLDKLPNEKGKIDRKYTEDITKMMYENRNQLYNGGSFYYNESQYALAYLQFAKFLDVMHLEPLKQFDLTKDKTTNAVAAYNTVLCAMRLEDYNLVLRYIDLAISDSLCAEQSYHFKAMAEVNLGDTATWVNTLKTGSQLFPENVYFYQSLIQYYDDRNEQDEMFKFADAMIASDPKNPLFIYVKGYISQRLNKTDDAIKWYKQTLEIEPNYENSLSNLGLCYIQQAQEYNDKHSATKLTDKVQIKKDKDAMNGFFSNALPIYEKLRELHPDRTVLWFNGLHNCYYNLNKADKLKEIEKLFPQE